METTTNEVMEVLSHGGEEDCDFIAQNDPGRKYGQPLVTGFISALGLVFNGIVILVIIALKDYKKTSHWYVLNLAFADSIFLLMLPFHLIENLLGRWPFGLPLCVAYNTSFYVNYYAGIFFLTAMSFDRYVAIVHPVSSMWRKFRSNRGCWITTISVWILAILVALPLLVKTKVLACHCSIDFEPDDKNIAYCISANIPLELCEERIAEFEEFEGSLDEHVLSELVSGDVDANETNILEMNDDGSCSHIAYPNFVIWVHCNFILTFVNPILVMIVCYSCILWRVLHPRIPSSRTSSYRKGAGLSSSKRRTSSTSSSTGPRNNHRITMIVVSLVSVFVLCWFPFHAVHLLKLGGMNLDVEGCHRLNAIVLLLAFSNSLLNPVFYTFLGANFHRRLVNVWNSIKARNAATKEIIASFKISRQSGRSRKRGSTSRKSSKATDSSEAQSAASANIHLHLLNRTYPSDQCTNSTATCKTMLSEERPTLLTK